MSNVAAQPVSTRFLPAARYLWMLQIAFGVVGGVVYYATASNYRLGAGIYIFVSVTIAAACAWGVVFSRPVNHTPWLLISAGLCAFVAGDVVYYLSEAVAEIPYTIGYALLIAAFVIGSRVRDGKTPFVALQDAFMVTVAGFVTIWLIVVEPADLVTSDWVTFFEVIVFPILDLVLLTVILRSMFGPEAFSLIPRVLLFAGGLLTLLCDVSGIVATTHESSSTTIDDRVLNLSYAGYLPAYALFAAAALHPLMGRVFVPLRTDQHQPDTTRLRLVVVLATPIVPLLTAAVLQFRGTVDSLLLVFLGSILLFGLAFARLKSLITDAAHRAEVDERLRAYSEVLIGTHDREVAIAAAEKVGEFVLDREVVVARPGEAPAGMVVAPVQIDGRVELELAAPSGGGGYASRRTEAMLAVIADNLSVTFAREEALQREQAALESLQAQNARLLELDSMKEAFVSMVSHELRTPLTSIVGYMELIREGEAGDVTEEQEAFFTVIDRNLTRLQRLVDDILVVARADAGRMTLTPEELDLAQLVRRCVESAGPVAAGRNVGLSAEIADDLPTIVGDRRLLAQMLDNLVSNGVKFTPDGGSVTVEAVRSEDRVELMVRDTGAGIPEDEIPQLFERFFRASTAGAVQGTGLGLAITKSIVEEHGGEISIESEVGVGSTFHVVLPLAPPPTNEESSDTGGNGS